MLQGFNAGLFDYLIATDDSDSKDKEQTDGDNQGERKKSKKHKKRKADAEFGVVRGIDFKNVYTVNRFFADYFPQCFSLNDLVRLFPYKHPSCNYST